MHRPQLRAQFAATTLDDAPRVMRRLAPENNDGAMGRERAERPENRLPGAAGAERRRDRGEGTQEGDEQRP